MKKYKGWAIFILGFIIGFVLAAHWQGGRSLIQGVSPIYNKNVSQGVQQLGQGLKESGEKVKDTIVPSNNRK